MHTSGSRFSTVVLLFLAIAAGVLTMATDNTVARFEEHWQETLQNESDGILDIAACKTASLAWAWDAIAALMTSYRACGSDSPQLQRDWQAVCSTYNISLQAAFFQHRRLVTLLPENAVEGPLLQQLIRALATRGEEYRQQQRDLHRRMLDVFGPGNRLDLMLRARGRLRALHTASRRGYYYWQDFRDGTSVFFLISEIPDFLARFNLYRPRCSPQVGAATPDSDCWLPPHGTTADQFRMAWQLSRGTGGRMVEYAGVHWVFATTQQGDILACTRSPHGHRRLRHLRGLVQLEILLTGLLFVLLILSYAEIFPGTVVNRSLESTSIRVRLLGLFAMAAALPLGLGILLGSVSFLDRRARLITDSNRAALERLRHTEQGYLVALQQFQELCERLSTSTMLLRGDLAAIATTAQRLQASGGLQRLEVRDGNGSELYSTDDPEVHAVNEAFGVFSRLAIRQYAPQRMADAHKQFSAAELLSESILSTDESGLAGIFSKPGQLWDNQLGNLPAFWYWNVFPELSSGPAFLALVHQLDFIFRKHLRETLAKTRNSDGSLQIAVEICRESGRIYPFPHLTEKAREAIVPAMYRARISGRVLAREINIGTCLYWAVIKPETITGQYVLAHLTPVASRLHTLQPYIRQIIFFVVLVLSISLLAAILLARLFIIPVQDIGAGIAAIRRRDSGFRIALRRPDELGALAQAFNSLLDNLEELQYGRIVQDSLLPTSLPAPPGYAVACWRRTATDLAGDYHDASMLGDGRFCVILGDVTGYGVSAALAMAMAKATIDFYAVHGHYFPVVLMDQLNALFFQELKPRQKFMTLVCAVLDQNQHRCLLENSGHLYPLHYSHASQTITEFSLPSFPLGARKTRQQQTATCAMQHGDTLMFYSNGFVECADHAGNDFGFLRCRELFGQYMRQGYSAEQLVQALGASLDGFRRPGPYPDDVTVIVLQRLNP